MKRILSGVTALAAGTASCALGPGTPPASETQRATDVALADELARHALYEPHHVRRVVYTWTTHDQILELQRGSRLLTREASPTHGISYFEQVVAVLAKQGDPTAELLDTTTYAKMRFAWHAPWATLRGWPGEQYGNELIRVVLRRDAIVLALSTATGTFSARDMDDHDVALAEVRAHPERIGAVYFISDATHRRADLPEPTASYRELVLCNEAAIESWDVGSEAIARELEREANMLDALAAYLREHPMHAPHMRDVWGDVAPPLDIAARYAAGLAFDNGSYELDAGQVATLAELLRHTPRAISITTVSNVPFAGAGVRRVAPRAIAPRTPGTYGTMVGTYVRPGKAP